MLDIQAVDETRREIYFTAVGREAGRDPYYRHLYRSALDGRAGPTLLTEPNADHMFLSNPIPAIAQMFGTPGAPPLIQAAADVFVDTWSTVDQPPISVLRSTRDGHVIAELERADASRLYASGWIPPVRERVKAADGVTDLYAVYRAPHGRVGAGPAPVIDDAYGGPQLAITPRNFTQAYRQWFPIGGNALARLGFAVVTVDGRGTPMRSRAFRDVGYPEFTQVGIDDHVAAIRELAQRHPEMDLSRVGVYGWSWGGTFAAQAILSRPEFYKTAVAGAGVYDYTAIYSGFESAIGPPVYADGSQQYSKPEESPANWNPLEVPHLADHLVGHLLLIYAELDENAPSNQTFRLVDALTRANKSYDLICLPNRDHFSGQFDGYTLQRIWDYFVEHLLGAKPVRDYKVETGLPAPYT